MITLKLWNSVSQETRSQICRIIGVSGKVEETYHHNFDFDALGAKIKSVLESCNLQKDGTINVVVNIKPTMPTKKPAIKTTANKSPKGANTPFRKPEVQPAEPKKWKFRMYTKDDPDDGCWVWAYGYTESEARSKIEQDYWNIERLECYGTI